MDPVTLGVLLKTITVLAGEFRRGRDSVIAAGNPTNIDTGLLKSDAELIGLFQVDSKAATSEIDQLIAKRGGH